METTVIKDNTQALALRERVNRLKRRREKLDREIQDKIEEMHVACIHNEYTTEDKYYEGSYLDRCQYVKIYTCKICGKELKRDITYGGFN